MTTSHQSPRGSHQKPSKVPSHLHDHMWDRKSFSPYRSKLLVNDLTPCVENTTICILLFFVFCSVQINSETLTEIYSYRVDQN